MKLIPWVVQAFFVLVFAIAAQAQPYITPYQPGGWSDKIVVTTNPIMITMSDGAVILKKAAKPTPVHHATPHK